MDIIGLILKASYQLNRHRIGPARLNLVPLLLALTSGLLWKAGYLTGAQAISIIVLCLILVLITLLARRQGFIVFRQRGTTDCRMDRTELAADEKVPVRASGLFEVRDRQRYLVEVTADFATMETREHIVMGRMLDARFLVGTPKADAGWWYIFFMPFMIREIEVGKVHFGLHSRSAIKVEYEAEEERVESIYLSFDEAPQMQRVLEDLRRDAEQAFFKGVV